jgi:hypothetical protein
MLAVQKLFRKYTHVTLPDPPQRTKDPKADIEASLVWAVGVHRIIRKQDKQRRPKGERDSLVDEAYKHLGCSRERTAIELARWINLHRSDDKYRPMTEGNVVKTKPWLNLHPKPKK